MIASSAGGFGLLSVPLEILLGAAAVLLAGLCLTAVASLALQLRTRRRVGEVAARLAELDRLHERSERVDFAVRLPGAEGDADTPVWLPIDAKFPQDDFERLVDAQEAGNAAGAAEAGRALEARVRSEARSIREKYVCPPHTTDFALLFLPTEALYAELLRRPGLVEWLQRECRVALAGPTTLAALLNSLQLGFRTLAIQKRSDEVWQLLGAVRTHFGKFGDLLDKVDKKLHEASNTIGHATRKTRYIEKRLGRVQALPDGESRELLPELAGEAPSADEGA